MAKPKADKPFEQAMTELESIVARLEAGEVPLEEALAAFEQGVGLVRKLSQRLSAAEERVEILTREADGTLRLQPATVDVGNES